MGYEANDGVLGTAVTLEEKYKELLSAQIHSMSRKGRIIMKEIFFFETMLTPKIITFVYWLMLLGSIVGGVGMMFSGDFIAGLGVLIGGCVGARIWCELLMVFFKINEGIKKLASQPQ